MQELNRLNAIAAPLPIENVDTDKILPARFLKTITRKGLGHALFWTLRQDAQFVLNRAPWNQAGILIALDNFGCGSSREHAPWALLDFGIRCVIAPSIADIFYSNCFRNGILPVVLAPVQVQRLMILAACAATAHMSVDLETQTIRTSEEPALHFEVDPRRKHDLLHGVDEIQRTADLDAIISVFEDRQRRSWTWLADVSGL